MLKKRLLNPYAITVISVVTSVLVFLLITAFVEFAEFTFGLILSAVIPAITAPPVSIVVTNYHQKVERQKEALDKLDSVNKKLFSIIAHDIRSPIASLQGFVNLLTSDALSLEEGREGLQTISRKIDDLLVFLNDLLAWSVRQLESEPLVPESFSCGAVVQPVLKVLSEAIETKKIHIEQRGLHHKVHADRGSYAFIVRNILHNAIKFTQEEGHILVSVKKEADECHTVIKDNGIGISPSDLHKITNSTEFFSTRGTSNEAGTGFGMNACIQYLHAQGGRLIVDSEPGKGTSMTIVLPNGAA